MFKTTDADSLGVDWAEFEGDSRGTCFCNCGAQFRSHTKIVSLNDELVQVYEYPCPGCDKVTGIFRTSYEYESFTITSDDVEEI
jgi:hypothetical protein